MTTPYNAESATEQEAIFLGRNDLVNRWGNTVSTYLELPGLVGFWPMSSVQRSTGNAYDMSEQNRTLTYNGNPTYNIYNNLIPYIDLDGTGDYLSRADETDLDVLGTETIYASAVRGLTFGGWFWVDVLPGTEGTFISKFNTVGNNRSYSVLVDNTGVVQSRISIDGTALTVVLTPAISTGAWYNIICRFVPSTSLSVFINGVETQNAAAIPASIFNGNADFMIGAIHGGTRLLDGRACLCFLCANSLPDALINSLFQQTRVLFGV